MTNDELNKLKELAEQATPGPWVVASSLPTYAVAAAGKDILTATGREYRQNHKRTIMTIESAYYSCQKASGDIYRKQETEVHKLRAQLAEAREVIKGYASCCAQLAEARKVIDHLYPKMTFVGVEIARAYLEKYK